MLTRLTPLALLAAVALSGSALSGCGGNDAGPTTTAPAEAPAAGATPADATTTPTEADSPAAPAEVTVKGKGMKGGCDALHKLFLALDDNDQATAEAYRAKARVLFDDVAAQSYKDLDYALDGSGFAAFLQNFEPDKPYYTQQIAPDYAKICVTKYDAPAL